MTEHDSLPARKDQGGNISEVIVNDQSPLPHCGGAITPYEQDARLMEHDSLYPMTGYRVGTGWAALSNRMGKFVSATWAMVLVIIGLEAAMVLFGISIGINPTESQPYRFFLILKNSPFGQGDLVAFRFPGSEYYSEGSLFVKEVRGMPGDRLEIRNDHTVWLNGRFLDTVRAADSQGKAVKPFSFNGLLPEGHYFLYSSAPNSYDSRYYGLIGKERMVGKAIPLW